MNDFKVNSSAGTGGKTMQLNLFPPPLPPPLLSIRPSSTVAASGGVQPACQTVPHTDSISLQFNGICGTLSSRDASPPTIIKVQFYELPGT